MRLVVLPQQAGSDFLGSKKFLDPKSEPACWGNTTSLILILFIARAAQN